MFSWLVHIQRVRASMAHIAERAAACALVTHDHEGGRALAKAFSNVGAGGFFADGVQIAFAQDLLDLVKAGAGAAGLDANPLGLLQHLGRLNLDGDSRQFGAGLLLGRRVVVLGALRFAHDFGSAHGLFTAPADG
jgi:hypothetical protein